MIDFLKKHFGETLEKAAILGSGHQTAMKIVTPKGEYNYGEMTALQQSAISASKLKLR